MQIFSADATIFLFLFFDQENLKKPASKVAYNRSKCLFFQKCQPAQIQPKCQFLFHKNLPPRDFSILTLATRKIDNDTFEGKFLIIYGISI